MHSATDQIKVALTHLDRLLADGIEAAQRVYGLQSGRDSFRGLYISPEDVTHLLKREPGDSLIGGDDRAAPVNLIPETGPEGIFIRLKRLFGLRSFDLNLVLLALAPELDVRYERLYAYLQDDVTRRRPSIDLAFTLLCPSLTAKIEARGYLAPVAPLMRYHIVELIEDPAQPHSPLIKKYLKLDERIIGFLSEDDAIDTRLADSVCCISPQAGLQSLVLPKDQVGRLDQLVRETQAYEQGAIFYFQGPYGVGKQSCAKALCGELGLRLLLVDLGKLLADASLAFETALVLIEREARLGGCAIFFSGFDKLLDDKNSSWLAALLRSLNSGPRLVFLAGNQTWEPSGTLYEVPFIRVLFDMPTFSERMLLWRSFLDSNQPDSNGLDLDSLANKFRLSGGQIKDAVSTARNLARWRKPEQAIPGMQNLYNACRLQSNRKLSNLAQKVRPCFHWEDIVLPRAQNTQLKLICTYVQQRARVMDTWGFARKLSLGKGINALFAGPSGTGKTMAADIIANALGLDLYKIDLSTVISKYIGETEKNLAQIFMEAETSNAVLFFDEADALFGKRSEVKDSHDRYANIEISYLLQRMEEYEGVSILATNLRQNMDEAFVRRVAFTIHFPMPEESSRLQIWRKIWPPQTPREPDLDLEFLARHFRFSGGSIKNTALAAAYMAAEDGQAVAMTHLIRATREELLKMGKACVKADFGKYFDLLQANT